MKTRFALPAIVFLATSTLSLADQADAGTTGQETEATTGKGAGLGPPRRGGGRPSRQRQDGPGELGAAPGELGAPGIAWYGRLDIALAEAQRSNRPVMFMSAASQCGGVPGVF